MRVLRLGLVRGMRVALSTMVVATILLSSHRATAGGISLRDPEFTFDESSKTLSVCANLENYHYSNGQTKNGIAVLTVTVDDAPVPRLFVWRPPGGVVPVCIKFPLGVDASFVAVNYYPLLEFSTHALSAEVALPIGEASNDVQTRAATIQKYLQKLGEYKIKGTGGRPPNISTYLKVNGETPSGASRIKPGVSATPLEFSWDSREVPSDTKMLYRFRLYPTQMDWSNWTSNQSTILTFIPAGIHVFEVAIEAERGGKTYELPTAKYQFTLEEQYIGPGVTKGGPSIKPTKVDAYTWQRALIVGVTDYKKFDKLSFVKGDVEGIKALLPSLGFRKEDIKVATQTDSQSIMRAINTFLNDAKDGEQSFIYLSGHGFPAKDSEEDRAYFAGSDCDMNDLTTCVSLNAVKEALTEAISRKQNAPRHILLIVDACFAGRTIVAKGVTIEIAAAKNRAVHIMAAGTRDEVAVPDREKPMSVFTRYLIEGLSGKADLLRDDVITLSELGTWVRWQVASATQGAQTPSFTRIKGAGEMMFNVPRSP